MPHRKGLGELATDQRASTQLGRLVLRGELDAALGLAGETYLALWRGYVWTLAGPRELNQGDGHGFTCGGCEEAKHCRCEFRKRIYLEARDALNEIGWHPAFEVFRVAVADCPPTDVVALRVGLSALAHHFGLTPRANNPIGKISIGTAPPGP